ncbi:afadin [Genypterus blacodes]|uniref:afadin n=1 Tax=Genypterus blacodes TaxID=154954 RepID=UPI003F76BDE6
MRLNGGKDMPEEEEEEERENLGKVIRQWNNSRVDLFEISQPDENLEFHGVMRFYFEDRAAGNVATKCLRVCSSYSTREVIETLSEKFRPDMKMLTSCYSLYEIHTNKKRKLDLDERPLIVQLNWNSDNREGRFVLMNDRGTSEKENCQEKKDRGGVIQNFKRTLSKKEKKEKNKTKASEKAPGERSTEMPLNNNNGVCVCDRRCIEHKKEKQREAEPEFPLSDFTDKPGLPMGIKVCHESEEAFLSAVINYTNSSTVHFKLSPAYVLYAAGRVALQRRCSRGPLPLGRTHAATSISNKMVAVTEKVIQKQHNMAGALAFWMANASELLNFFKQDRELSLLTLQAQEDLSHLVHKAYSFLIQCLQNELRKHLPTFLADPEQHGPLPAGIEMVLNTLMNAMSLLRRCRVNPALTIQLFSQLFHFISAWLFNQLMSPEAGARGLLRSHYWGAALRQRLSAMEAWAERQGLELAADCHLGHVSQATMLLTMNKYSIQDVKDIQSTCFKLNSLQLHMLLSRYMYAANEPRIPPDVMDAVVTAAAASADNLIQSEGRCVELEESLDLHLPFLLPEGGYSCDAVRGVPPGLREFLEPICRKGLCTYISRPHSEGDWTVFFTCPTSLADHTQLAEHRAPQIVAITLNKPLNSGMGVSIVAAKGAGQGNLGIYIKSIVKGGPAEMNGGLTAGDQLLSVDGQSLVGLSQERAAAIMMQTGPVVTLQVAKLAASRHGLEALLSEATSGTAAGDKIQSCAEQSGKVLVLHSDAARSQQQQQQLCGNGKTKKEQILQRNRQLYRSDPNMTTGGVPENGERIFDPVVRSHAAAVSTINVCTDTYQREYLTLPTPKSQEKKLTEPHHPQHMFKVSFGPSDGQSSSKRTFMRQALSQENLCVDSRGPLLVKPQHVWERQTTSHYSSFPMRPSVSAHDILSDHSSPTKHAGGRTSGAGLWRTPLSQHATPSVQPIRIDIPITRAVETQSKLPLTTFQQGCTMLPLKLGQHLKVNGQTNQGVPKQNFQSYDVYSCPISVSKRPPQPSIPLQQHRPNAAAKPQVNITPTKHVSFQNPPASDTRRQKAPEEISDQGRREAQEKQRRFQEVELLEQEVQGLRAKADRTVEENGRLRRLSLEWQFQRRLQEFQQGDDEDEEEDEEIDMMVTIQQLERRAQSKKNSGGNVNSQLKELGQPAGSQLSYKEDEEKTTTDQRLTGLYSVASKEEQEEERRRVQAPEKLTFKERQQLFSLASSA